MTIPPFVYVFGCFRDRRSAGHYAHGPFPEYAGPVISPFALSGMDDPGGVAVAGQIEGRLVPVPVVLPGMSAVRWWDRQGDSRGGSVTGVAAPGDWTAAQLVEAARRHAPWAIRVPIVLPDDGGAR
jgi:hypothetical protein